MYEYIDFWIFGPGTENIDFWWPREGFGWDISGPVGWGAPGPGSTPFPIPGCRGLQKHQGVQKSALEKVSDGFWLVLV